MKNGRYRRENLFTDKKDKNPRSDKQTAAKRRRRNLRTLFENTSIYPFSWTDGFSCFYCDKKCNYEDLKKHTKSHSKAERIVLEINESICVDVSNVSCDICDSALENLENILHHLSDEHCLKLDLLLNFQLEQYKLSDLSCVSCMNKFDNFVDLKEHNDTHQKKTWYNECDQIFVKKNDLETNAQKHLIPNDLNNIEQLVCTMCYKVFDDKKMYKLHVKSECGHKKCKQETLLKKMPPKLKAMRESLANFLNMTTAMPFKFFMQRYRCFYCSKDYEDFAPLRTHTAEEHTHCDPKSRLMKLIKGKSITIKIDTYALSCKVCGKSIETLDAMLTHLNQEHKYKFDETFISAIQTYRLEKDRMPCLYCGVTFRYFSKLLEHMNEFHSQNKIICPFCGQVFGKDPNYRSHLKRHHNPNALKCNDCHLEFSNLPKLTNHRAKFHGDKTYKCAKCSETFGTQYKKQKHLIDVHGSGHPCTYCGKLFTRNSFMIDHVRRTHLKEKNAECSVCKEKFFDNILLRQHMIKHIGERNFHCDICGKTFLWKKNLRGHMSSHK